MSIVVASYGPWEWAHIGVTGLAIIATLVVLLVWGARRSRVGDLLGLLELWGPPLVVILAAYLLVGDLRRAVARGEAPMAAIYSVTVGLLALWGALAVILRLVAWWLLRTGSSPPQSVAGRVFREAPMAYHAGVIAMLLSVSDFSMLQELEIVPPSSLHDRLSESLRRSSVDQVLLVEAVAASDAASPAVADRQATLIRVEGSRLTLETRRLDAVQRNDVVGSMTASPEMRAFGAGNRLAFDWHGDLDLESTDTWYVSGNGIRHDQFVLARQRGVTQLSSGLTSPFWSPFRVGILVNPAARTGLFAITQNLETLFFRPFRILVLDGGMALISCRGRFTLLVDLENKQVAHFLPFAFGEAFAISSAVELEGGSDDAATINQPRR